jgi:uncharacterized protein YbjQ (UPF0145 family)
MCDCWSYDQFPEASTSATGSFAVIVTTTSAVEGKRVIQYLGIVAGDAVIGANLFRDFFASITDVIGGRSGSYEATMAEGRQEALRDLIDEAQKLGADAVIGLSVDVEGGLNNGSMMMVSATGTAVRLG